jgi:hypothetical protein
LEILNRKKKIGVTQTSTPTVTQATPINVGNDTISVSNTNTNVSSKVDNHSGDTINTVLNTQKKQIVKENIVLDKTNGVSDQQSDDESDEFEPINIKGAIGDGDTDVDAVDASADVIGEDEEEEYENVETQEEIEPTFTNTKHVQQNDMKSKVVSRMEDTAKKVSTNQKSSVVSKKKNVDNNVVKQQDHKDGVKNDTNEDSDYDVGTSGSESMDDNDDDDDGESESGGNNQGVGDIETDDRLVKVKTSLSEFNNDLVDSGEDDIEEDDDDNDDDDDDDDDDDEMSSEGELMGKPENLGLAKKRLRNERQMDKISEDIYLLNSKLKSKKITRQESERYVQEIASLEKRLNKLREEDDRDKLMQENGGMMHVKKKPNPTKDITVSHSDDHFKEKKKKLKEKSKNQLMKMKTTSVRGGKEYTRPSTAIDSDSDRDHYVVAPNDAPKKRQQKSRTLKLFHEIDIKNQFNFNNNIVGASIWKPSGRDVTYVKYIIFKFKHVVLRSGKETKNNKIVTSWEYVSKLKNIFLKEKIVRNDPVVLRILSGLTESIYENHVKYNKRQIEDNELVEVGTKNKNTNSTIDTNIDSDATDSDQEDVVIETVHVEKNNNKNKRKQTTIDLQQKPSKKQKPSKTDVLDVLKNDSCSTNVSVSNNVGLSDELKNVMIARLENEINLVKAMSVSEFNAYVKNKL